jgi:COMPASS component SWD2
MGCVSLSLSNRLAALQKQVAQSDSPLSLSFVSLSLCSHHDQAVLFAGKGSPTQPAGQRHAVNYWSVYDNKILRKFKGHSDAVTTISMCPADDTFLTSSADGTVRLWTLQQAGCVAEMKLPAEAATGTPVSVFDSTGLVFAIAAAMADDSKEAGHYLHLYDARNYAAGAFAELKVAREDLEKAIQSHAAATISQERAAELSRADWASMQFNASGNQILVGAGQGMSIVLDGFEGTVQRVLVDRPSSASSCCCFTSDDKTVLQGNDDGSITCWSVESGTVVKRLEGHPGPVTCVAANPMYTQIASACANTALWTW